MKIDKKLMNEVEELWVGHEEALTHFGILKFAGIVWSIQKLGRIVDKIERLPIKTLEKKDEEPPC